MKYTNIKTFSELNRIKECHKKDNLDDVCRCIYTKNTNGIRNYLIENNYINSHPYESIQREVPALTSYGEDFIKKAYIKYFLLDYTWSIGIIVVPLIIGIILKYLP